MLDKAETPLADNRAPDIAAVEAVLAVGKQRSRSRRRWRVLGAVLVAAGLALGLYGFWPGGASRDGIRFTTQPVSRGNLTVVVTATGSAQPITQVSISSELSGTIRKVLVDYNSVVRSGQVLAELDPDKLAATVASARARLSSAKARVAEAIATIAEKRAEHDRKALLSQTSAGSMRDLEVAKANHDRSIAQHDLSVAEVAAAEADLRLAEINLAKASIVSPIDGVVLKRGVDPGQFVATSLQAPVLFVVAEDLHRMEVLVDVDEAEVGKVKVGQKVTFGVDAYPDRKFPAAVRDIRFGSEVVQGVVTYKAVLSIDNSDLSIRPGMTATAQILVQEVENAVLVPNAALRFSPPAAPQQGGGFLKALLPSVPSATRRPPSKHEDAGRGPKADQKVWILRDGAPVAVPVSVGSSDGRVTEIRKGQLSPGDAVVVDAVSSKR
ncbi:efflux RND transporter periplasmic adaptor subunit [Rhodoplanes azumiensis]|uniref:Efflux RND transporter periplasmic adaptor subunit n=1 Tax=Rhodoplanes azumiensis TaxID=1897628 RepID=A0ABW5AHY0_9BRAD